MAYQNYPGSRYNDLYQQYPQPKPQTNPVDAIGPALDTRNPRPSYARAAGGAPTAPAASAPAPASGALSPELAGLQHSAQSPLAPTPAPASTATPAATPAAPAPTNSIPSYLQPIVDAIPGLSAPATLDQGVINQVTRSNQGATDIAANQLRERMASGSGGLVRPGESGLADTALASVYRGGAADTAKTLGGMAADLPQLNLQRALAAGNLGQMVSGEDLARQKFGYGQEMDALNLLMQQYAQEQAAQQSAWAPYYSGYVNAYGG